MADTLGSIAVGASLQDMIIKEEIMKRVLIFMLIAVLVVLTGCAKLVNTEYETVDVKITDKYYRSAYMTPVRAGKATTFVTHPAVHRIYIEYKGVEYTISGSTVYHQYKDKIGQTVKGKLKIDTYDDESIKYSITELWEE